MPCDRRRCIDANTATRRLEGQSPGSIRVRFCPVLLKTALLRAIPEPAYDRRNHAADHQGHTQIARAIVELIGLGGDAKETESHGRCHDSN